MDRPGYKAVILDMDGVITQTAKLHARAWKQMFDEFLLKRQRETGDSQPPFDIEADYLPYVDGKPRYEGVKSFLQSRGIDLPFGHEDDDPDQPTVCGLGNRKNEIFQELLARDGVEVYDDAVEQIGHWSWEGLNVAVISSSRNCKAVLKAADLLDRFDFVIDGYDADRLGLKGKPAPDVFLHAARQLGVAPSQVIVVEDAVAGVQAGRTGQFGLVLGVARNQSGDDLREAGADAVVADLRKLQTMIQCPPQEDPRQTPSSALEHFDRIAERLRTPSRGSRTHRLALFLDYDGTLTPIVRRPEEAQLSDDMRSLLEDLSKRCPVAIVSGRDRRDVENLVRVDNLVYAGSHGFDIRGPDGLQMQQPEAVQALPELDTAETKLRQNVQEIEGARIERKRFAIAVHYRGVTGEEDVQRVEKLVDQVIGEHPGLRKRGGKKIFELQPDVEWDKGRAVLWLAEALGLNRSGVVVIYIGDDVTDEDAFRALRRVGVGIGIRVALPSAGTHAHYSLRDCDEVETFLTSLRDTL